MPICKTRKLAFCHIPRTGGVSVSNALSLYVNDKHFPASFYREHYPDYTLFATLRPYDDRIISTFGGVLPVEYGKPNFQALIDHIKDKGADNIGLMLKPNEYFLDCEVDYLLRYEHLQDDLNKMLHELGHKEVRLVQCNSFKK